MKVYMPFTPVLKDRMLHGDKTQTSRTKAYGEQGDTFEAFGAVFQLTEVFKRHLGLIAEKDYQAEGFTSPEEFEAIWAKLYPKRGFRPDDRVWVHRFKLLGERK